MEIGIIGLPQSGKTTVFNALTRGKAETAPFSPGGAAPNIGVVKVPDPRLGVLNDMFKPKRTIPAEVKYVDIAAKDFGKGEGVSGQFLTHISKADAIIHVVRVFEDKGIPHPEGSVDPQRDIAAIDLEIAFSDLAIIERRLQRLEVSLKGAKQQEREANLREQALLERIKTSLEAETPIREHGLVEEEARTIENYQFLTAKPLLLLLNIGEEQLSKASSLEEEFRHRYRRPNQEVAALCGKLEMELGQLSDADAEEFRAAMDMAESGLDRVIRLSYELLGLISFFTTISDEVKAWTIRRDTTALKAAGKIHSDMEKGFIRAKVVSANELVEAGDLHTIQSAGHVRTVGKDHEIMDGDVVEFLF